MYQILIKTILKMNDKEKYEVQKLLYVWLGKLGRRSLESIKVSCDYLVESRNITVDNSIWEIFWPLVFSGVADHIGKGYYALTEPIILNYHSFFYYINYLPQRCETKEISVGIYVSRTLSNEHDIRIIDVSPKNILKKFPSINKVVDGFSKSIQDVNELRYYNMKTRIGMAELEKEGFKRFFSIPDQLYLRELPDRTVNPDAFAITYCYHRVINNESNGTYKHEEKELITPAFAIPFTLFRVLQLETMASQIMPKRIGNTYVFSGVSESFVKELNRILCNSIRYE